MWPSEDRVQRLALWSLLAFAIGWALTIGWHLGLQPTRALSPDSQRLIGASFLVLTPAAFFAAFQLGARGMPKKALGGGVTAYVGLHFADMAVQADATGFWVYLLVFLVFFALDLFEGWRWPGRAWRRLRRSPGAS